MMVFPSARSIFTHLTAALVGAAIAITLAYRLEVQAHRFLSVAMIEAADDAHKSGNEVETIFLLGGAANELHTYYLPWERLGKIYEARDEVRPALTTYEKALQILDKWGDPFLSSAGPSERQSISDHIKALQNEVDQHDRPQGHK